ncbi:MAG: N-6 DNA methylase [Bacteroidota bacterium]|nr:N-6 DNA methylase [Bacteroidota bacterium]
MNNILQYESKVWSTADLLIGAGIKQSDFPKYMMPYFALIMLESRLERHSKELLADFGKSSFKELDNVEDYIEEFKDFNIGYNDLVVRHQKTLAEICKNDKTFDNDFNTYLNAFDPETKELLGVDRANTEEKYMDISGLSGQLRKKKILFDTVKKWSEIDLTPFNNSEITTLEEHIKRKWADISAETAGEQYTPDDIIALISEIILSKIEDNEQFLTIYDPTCGGGNLLFGVEDKIKAEYNRPTKTYGQDWSDSLYALAKIESRFRTDSEIVYGNTLVDQKFSEKEFSVIVANPPYGVDWKGYRKDIENDQTGRFKALPSISDGQFLFTQHVISQLASDGLAVVVHNGSTLFSGDAGSGESNIRKYFFDNDYVEAIIQLPTDEFFNTGIYTYLWILNKNKEAARKDRILLINASDFYKPLKKSKGKKRKEMALENRKEIVTALGDFENTDFAKVYSKHHFYFNKQAILLTNVDVNGKALALPTKVTKDGTMTTASVIKLQPKTIAILDSMGTDGMSALNEMSITGYDHKRYSSLKEYYDNDFKNELKRYDYKHPAFLLITETGLSYYFDTHLETLIEKDEKGNETQLGCGKIVLKASYKKATSKTAEHIAITAQLTQDQEKDYEIIPYHVNAAENQAAIAAFMKKYITKPFDYIDNTIGVEINFNKEFYIPEKLRTLSEITSELSTLEKELQQLEKELAL